MPTPVEHADAFHRLHVPGRPVVLYNVWDAGTAQAVARAGAKAIATGSWSVAAATAFRTVSASRWTPRSPISAKSWRQSNSP